MNASSDRVWDRSIAIGQENAEIIELAHRHCQLMKFVEAGGQGMAEEATGLPINMRRIECPKAHGNMGGMRLDMVAGEFYRAHCIGCELRQPTGELPTLATLIVEEDVEAERRDSERTSTRNAALEAWRKRSGARHAAMVAADQATVAILKDLEILDSDPSSEPIPTVRQAAIARLIALASRAPQLFTRQIVDALMILVDDVDADPKQGQQSLRDLMAPLRIVALEQQTIRADIVALALRVLQKTADPEAARLLVEFPDQVTSQDLSKRIVRNLVVVACAPQHDNIGRLGPNKSEDPASLLLAADIAVHVLQELLDSMLPASSPEAPLLLPPVAMDTEEAERVREFERGAAAAAIAVLLTNRPAIALPLLGSLVRNAAVEGDHYDTYPAGRVARTPMRRGER
jgi:hypothetical protein